MFLEADLETMIIEQLVSNGWNYISPSDLPRQSSDIMVESMVRNSLCTLNPLIASHPAFADEIIYKIRALFLSSKPHNLVSDNEKFKNFVFEQNSYPFGKDGQMATIRFFGTDDDWRLNQYVVTNQWVYPSGPNGKRLDLVLLVNGFPLAIGELKTPTRPSITWYDAAKDICDYQSSIPAMFVPNVFTFASEGKCFRYGAIKMAPDRWGPWHTPGNKLEGDLAYVRKSVDSMFKPEIVIDLLRSFTLFATDKKYQMVKIISRYQQYEGANLIVDRVKKGIHKKGLIWHFQGSGKSLLMVFAAQKLRMSPELKNPTIVIVDDRKDLDTQITSTFNASNVPNLETAGSREELVKFFENDTRKILITTIFKFGEVDRVLNERSNIIVLVDEAHRTQEGDLGAKMRQALPNAFFFGLTGTPINRVDKNTFATFGADADESGYMSLYSFSDSIRDMATLKLNFETAPVNLKINRQAVDEAFEELTAHLPDEDRNYLAKKIKIETIIKAPQRVRAVCEHVARHYREKIEPNGFKAQLVCYDRECCLLYKRELDQLMDADASTVVIDASEDKGGKFADFRRSQDQESRLLDDFRDGSHPLKILIVTSKLLTGFDAPILQAMYLDKPMRDHTLLQAICRTNRTCGQAKTHGLIVDYIGLFDDVAQALAFDDKRVKDVISNIEELKGLLPAMMDKCLARFVGVDRSLEGWDGLLAAQQALPDNETRDAFAADFVALSRAWEAISPDPFINPFERDYRWLANVYQSVRPPSGAGALIWSQLGAKTLEIAHQNIELESLPDVTEIIELDPDLIDVMFEKDKAGAERKAKELYIHILARVREHDKNQSYVQLGERLEELRDRHQQGVLTSLEFVKSLLQLARECAAAEKLTVPEQEFDLGKAALTELFNGVRNPDTPVIVERLVAQIDSIVKKVRFPNWQNTTSGQNLIKKQLRGILWLNFKIKDSEIFNKAYSYIEIYY
jgi:type I restriction enzyme R subunit